MRKKLIVDILMLILMILEFSRGFMLPIFHEIIGIVLFVLVIIHLILNKNYIKNISKMKSDVSSIFMFIINISFFITFILSIVFGILSSQDLLKFLNVHNVEIISLHKVFSYISLIILGFHLGINFNVMFGKLLKTINNYVCYLIQFVIVIYGIYSFIKLDIGKHITGTYGFSIVSGNIFINILEYLSIILMITFIVNSLYKIIISRRKTN